VQDSYLDRLSTLKNPEEEGSANSRIQLAKAAIAIWQDYPLLGVGFGGKNFAAIVSQYLGWRKAAVAHNTYVQLLADCGIFAFGLYCLLLFGTMLWIGRAARAVRDENPEMARMGIAIQTSLIGFAIGSAFLSRFQFDMYYILLMAAACWREIYHSMPTSSLEEEEGQSADAPVEAVSGAGA
jgi:O-antigen ligase